MRLLVVTQVVDTEHPNLGFFHGWLAEFARAAERVEVICLQEGRHALPPNVSIHSLGKERGGSKLSFAWRFLRYIHTLGASYDAVLVHMNPEYVVLGGWYWKVRGKKIGLWYTHKSVTWWLKIAEKFVDIIFTASKESFRLPSAKVRIMGHGIDTSLFPTRTSVPHTELRIVALGRVSESKRIHEMLRVLDVLHAGGTAFTFTVIGTGETKEDIGYGERLRADIAAKPYASRVVFAGAVPYRDIPRRLAEADVILHMSVTGSVDKAVLDALAAGTPVVSTSEAFKTPMPGVTSVSSDPAALADAITSQHVQPEELQAFVRETYSLKKLVAAILSALA